jgi:pyruvate dehydrogenase E1 component beta subunit
LISQVVEAEFSSLKKAPVRIASPDHPVPTSPFMAAEYYTGPREIAEAVVDLVGGNQSTGGYAAMCEALVRTGRHDAPNREFSGPF